MEISLKLMLTLVCCSIFINSATAQTPNAAFATGNHAVTPPFRPHTIPAYTGNRSVADLQFSFSGKSGLFISRKWILDHPQLTPSIDGYQLLSYDLNVLPYKNNYMAYGNCAADSNLMSSLAKKYTADSTKVFVENMVVTSQGQPAKVAGKGMYFIMVD